MYYRRDCLAANEKITTHRRGFMELIQRHPKLDATLLTPRSSFLMSKATAIVVMCGYKHVLADPDKPSLISHAAGQTSGAGDSSPRQKWFSLLSYIVPDESVYESAAHMTVLRAPATKPERHDPGLPDGPRRDPQPFQERGRG
jgi:hypothetical protein